jgi:hypothetical protein
VLSGLGTVHPLDMDPAGAIEESQNDELRLRHPPIARRSGNDRGIVPETGQGAAGKERSHEIG